MAWKLIDTRSDSGEQPGEISKIGYRGTKFSISRANRIYFKGYASEEPSFMDNSRARDYIQSVRNVLSNGQWAGSIRIRANKDTYAAGGRNVPIRYIGKTELGNSEEFICDKSGDLAPYGTHTLGATSPLRGSDPSDYPFLYSGPHNHRQVGERWTLPPEWWADEQGHFGNLGLRRTGEPWLWTSSTHLDFNSKMKDKFRQEINESKGMPHFRHYITCYGYIVRPIAKKFFDANGINIEDQINRLSTTPYAQRSLMERIERDTHDAHPYFVIGTVDNLLGGKMPVPDQTDPRTAAFNEDRRKG